VLVGVAPDVARILLAGAAPLDGLPVHSTLADALLATQRAARPPAPG
jgi:hypothetical protein